MTQVGKNMTQVTKPATSTQLHSTLAAPAVVNTVPIKIAAENRVFKSRTLAVVYVLKNGKHCPFLNGRYITNIQSEIDELQAEIDAGHPVMYVDNDEKVVSVKEPVEALRERFFKEFQEQHDKAANGKNDAGVSIQGKLNVANTASSEATSGASSSQ